MRLRQHLFHPLHAGENPRGNLLRLPSLLHRQAEVRRYRRPNRKIPEEIRRKIRLKSQKTAKILAKSTIHAEIQPFHRRIIGN